MTFKNSFQKYFANSNGYVAVCYMLRKIFKCNPLYISQFKEIFKQNIGMEYPALLLEGRELYPILKGEELIGLASARNHLYLIDENEFFQDAPDGYFLTGFSGHGFNSYACYLCFVDGAKKIYLRMPFGNLYANIDEETAHIRRIFEGLTNFLVKTDGLIKNMIFMEVMGGTSYEITTKNGHQLKGWLELEEPELEELELEELIAFNKLIEKIIDFEHNNKSRS